MWVGLGCVISVREVADECEVMYGCVADDFKGARRFRNSKAVCDWVGGLT